MHRKVVVIGFAIVLLLSVGGKLNNILNLSVYS